MVFAPQPERVFRKIQIANTKTPIEKILFFLVGVFYVGDVSYWKHERNNRGGHRHIKAQIIPAATAALSDSALPCRGIVIGYWI